MRDRNIDTMVFLAELLRDSHDEREELCESNHKLRDENYDLQHRIEQLEKELAYQKKQGLSARIETVSTADYTSLSLADTFRSVVGSPEAFMRAVEFMRSSEFRPAEKIAMIKRVRELGGFGLKDAKNLVETFAAWIVKRINAGVSDSDFAQSVGIGELPKG